MRRHRRRLPLEHELISRLDEAVDRILFLSEVSRILSSALTDNECFDRLLELVIPTIADWAIVTIVAEKGELQHVATHHIDPKKRQLLLGIGTKYPAHLDDEIGPGHIIARGKPELIPNYDMKFLSKARYPELANIIRYLGIHSKLAVPLTAHGQVLGSLWMATSDSGRTFTHDDLELALEIATRAAYTAYHLIRHKRTTRELEKLKIEIDFREECLARLRHDIRSVLSSASLSAQLILRSPSDRKDDFAHRIVDSIERASAILDKTKLIKMPDLNGADAANNRDHRLDDDRKIKQEGTVLKIK